MSNDSDDPFFQESPPVKQQYHNIDQLSQSIPNNTKYFIEIIYNVTNLVAILSIIVGQLVYHFSNKNGGMVLLIIAAVCAFITTMIVALNFWSQYKHPNYDIIVYWTGQLFILIVGVIFLCTTNNIYAQLVWIVWVMNIYNCIGIVFCSTELFHWFDIKKVSTRLYI